MNASLLDDVNHFMRCDVKLCAGEVDDLIVVVDAIFDARGDVRRQVRDTDPSRADRVDSLSSMIDRIRERHTAECKRASQKALIPSILPSRNLSRSDPTMGLHQREPDWPAESVTSPRRHASFR